MKVLETKTFKVTYVVPETPEEQGDIRRIIEEVKTEKIPPSGWNVVDNRPKKKGR